MIGTIIVAFVSIMMIIIVFNINKNFASLLHFKRFREQLVSLLILLTCGIICIVVINFHTINIYDYLIKIYDSESFKDTLHILTWIVCGLILSFSIIMSIYLWRKYMPPPRVKTMEVNTKQEKINTHGITCGCQECVRLKLTKALQHARGCQCAECQLLFKNGIHP